MIFRLLRRPTLWKFPKFDLDVISGCISLDDLQSVNGLLGASCPYEDFGGWSSQVQFESRGGLREFREVLDDLIGVRGMDRPTDMEFQSYRDYLLENYRNDVSVRRIVKDFKRKRYLRLTDLGSIVDMAILKPHLQHFPKPIRILEIGGGYGRLVESLVRNLNAETQIDMVDVVPSSLLLAYHYLSRSGIQTQFSRPNDFSVDKGVSLRVPADCAHLASGSINLVVNVESFQEMTQDWVNYWVELVQRITRDGSLFYSSNSFGYKNKFTLDLGPDWVIREVHQHPRHWTDSHRTEIWQRVR